MKGAARLASGSDATDSGAGGGRRGIARSAARLAAAQLLYQVELSGEPARAALDEFDRAGMAIEPGATLEADREFVRRIVMGVAERRDELDGLIAAALAERLSLERLEVLLRTVLRAGAFELLACPDVPARVVVAEHVAVAGAFYAGKETGLVNGVLDRLARRLRPAEMEAAGDAGPAAAG